MILVDNALKKLESIGKPIRVGIVGAGYMARGVALQILNHTPGMDLVAIANRSIDSAKRAYSQAGIENVSTTNSQKELDAAIEKHKYIVTDDPMLLARSSQIDILFECTGTIEHAAHVVIEAFKHKKHVAVMNAELDGFVGPLLKSYADKAGVIYTNVDGDQPGVEMNLYRFVEGLGLKPVLCGNIKGLQDPYRNPTTQANFAKQWLQNASMVTTFADGTKISFEQALVANATGMRVAKRGMHGFRVQEGEHINDAIKRYDAKELLEGNGIVDYLIGALPAPGVFVIGYQENPLQQQYLKYYKLGDGPFYSFYTPYHLCHLEVPTTLARAVLFNDATIAPISGPVVEVVALAKKDLKTGETIDMLGGYTVYGECENASTVKEQNLLPISLSLGGRLVRNIQKDQTLTFDDVEIPKNSFALDLYQKQRELFKNA